MNEPSDQLIDLEKLTLYSSFFRESRIPGHIHLERHIDAWAIEEWLVFLLRSRDAFQINSPPSVN